MYDTLNKLGYRTSRQITPISSDTEDGVLILLDPEIPLSLNEWQSLRDWTQKGNLLIISASGYSELAKDNAQKRSKAVPTYPSFLTRGVKSLAIPAGTSVEDEEWVFGYTSEPTKTHKSGYKVPKAVTNEQHVPLMPLFTSDAGTSIGVAKCGNGAVLQLCTGSILSNENIASDDNLIMLLNALSITKMGKKPTVTFDEFHHGYGSAPGITSLLDKPAKYGLAELVLAFLILVFAVSRRFGRPILLTEGQRQRSEYLYSMSRLLAQTRAISAVQEVLDKKFIEDLARYFGLPPTASADTILQTAKQRNFPGLDTLDQLVTTKGLPANNETSLLSLAVRRHRFRKELMNKK